MSRRPRSRLERSGALRSAPVFAALGDRRRLWILSRLSEEGPLSITRLASRADVSRQAISKHLQVLSEAGIVRGVRRGRERVFELERARLATARRDLEAISARWDAALERLARHVEE